MNPAKDSYKCDVPIFLKENVVISYLPNDIQLKSGPSRGFLWNCVALTPQTHKFELDPKDFNPHGELYNIMWQVRGS